jgi:glycosyltransferase involved in cell wall biosynthesis
VSSPEVSVVMGVFNGAETLVQAVRSILEQQDVELELVVVDDASTDATPSLLEDLARGDPRLRVLRQDRGGLTRALIRGCAEARGRFIARQDADDVSHPSRLRRQLDLLDGRRDVCLASCWARLVGPAGEELLALEPGEGPEEATRRLRAAAAAQVRGLTRHGTALFRRTDYDRAGGYRAAFAVAQDLDLWMRLTDHGLLAFVPEHLYTARLSPGSISMRSTRQQLRALELVVSMRRAREAGASEAPDLERAARLRPGGSPLGGASDAGGLYFIGRCLLDRRDPRSLGYLQRALRLRPLWPRAWAAWLRGRMAFGRG